MNCKITRMAEIEKEDVGEASSIIIECGDKIFRFYPDKNGRLRMNADEAIVISPQAANSFILDYDNS